MPGAPRPCGHGSRSTHPHTMPHRARRNASVVTIGQDEPGHLHPTAFGRSAAGQQPRYRRRLSASVGTASLSASAVPRPDSDGFIMK